jgi:hypothetical protein
MFAKNQLKFIDKNEKVITKTTEEVMKAIEEFVKNNKDTIVKLNLPKDYK